ncbi:MAG: hypothetical protein R3Y32_03480 [Bacillota bacterium]
MKNKIFRSAIAVILIFAMTFTLVACGSDTAVQTTTAPTTAPTSAPEVEVTTSGAATATPTVTDTKTEVSDDFSLKASGVDGVFGTDLEDDDDVEISPGYFKISWDSEEAQDQHYALDFEIDLSGDDDDYSFIISIPAGNSSATPTYDIGSSVDNTFSASTVYDDAYQATIDTLVVVLYEDYIIIQLENADEYELSADVTVTDKAVDYGAWNEEDETEFEFSLSAELEIEKEEIIIEIAPAVIKAGEYELQVLAAGTYDSSVKYWYDQGFTPNSDGDTIATTVYFPEYFEFGGYYISLEYEIDYTKEASVGSYAVSITESYKIGTLDTRGDLVYTNTVYDDLDDLNDNFANYEITAVKDTAVYVISEYDYTELADVITSIAEIDYTSLNGFFINGNIEVQLPLAISRYNALSTYQKAFLDTFADITFTNVSKSNVGAFLVDAIANDDIDYVTGEISSTDAIAYREYMDFAIEAYADYAVYTAFDEYAEDSDLPKNGETFNIYNSNHTSSFNLVDSYFNNLSDDDQDVIKTENSAWYQSYKNAYDDIKESEIDSVEQLIVAAYQAYIKALTNGADIIYQHSDTADEVATQWAYIYSEETQLLTAKAKTAFDALSEEQQDFMQDMSYEPLIINYYNASSANVVVFKSMQNTVYNALDLLVEMDEMVEIMVEICHYVNIEDYSTSIIPYTRLNMLVYGGGYGVGLYFPTYSETDGAQDYRYAMQDLINAPTRNYDAIIAEYKEWATYITEVEVYKNTALIEFMSQISAEAKKLDEDDYSSYVISGVADTSNAVAWRIVAAIMYEDISAYMESHDGTYVLTGEYAPSLFDATAIILTNEDVVPFFYAGFLNDKDNFEDVYESYDDFMDVDDILDSYMDAVLTNN